MDQTDRERCLTHLQEAMACLEAAGYRVMTARLLDIVGEIEEGLPPGDSTGIKGLRESD